MGALWSTVKATFLCPESADSAYHGEFKIIQLCADKEPVPGEFLIQAATGNSNSPRQSRCHRYLFIATTLLLLGILGCNHTARNNFDNCCSKFDNPVVFSPGPVQTPDWFAVRCEGSHTEGCARINGMFGFLCSLPS